MGPHHNLFSEWKIIPHASFYFQSLLVFQTPDTNIVRNVFFRVFSIQIVILWLEIRLTARMEGSETPTDQTWYFCNFSDKLFRYSFNYV